MNPKIRVIQGDGIDYLEIKNIIETLISHSWSIDNIAFGMGGGLLQKLNRDTQSFAMKCSSIVVNGVERDVFKSPIGGFKKSKKGRLKLIKEDEKFKTVNAHYNVEEDLLQPVFWNGEIVEDKFENIRKRALEGL